LNNSPRIVVVSLERVTAHSSYGGVRDKEAGVVML